MDDTLKNPDDNLRDRIRKGFETGTKSKSKKIEERPKTPHHSNKDKNNMTGINPVEIHEVSQEQTPNKKKKSVVRKPKIKTEVTDSMNKLTLTQTKEPTSPSSKTSTEKLTKPATGVYLCPKCDKTYKSKNGIVKHMQKCI